MLLHIEFRPTAEKRYVQIMLDEKVIIQHDCTTGNLNEVAHDFEIACKTLQATGLNVDASDYIAGWL
jgi:hypothetical protein